MRFPHIALVAVLFAPTAACDPFPSLCDTGIVDAVEVEIRNAVSLSPIADSAQGTVREGTYVDSLRPASGTVDGLLSLSGAPERPGVYEVHLTRVGYLPWDTAGVRVRDTECHVEQALVKAYMEQVP